MTADQIRHDALMFRRQAEDQRKFAEQAIDPEARKEHAYWSARFTEMAIQAERLASVVGEDAERDP